MKKLNKKGFTLIELLAVIVILAILVTVSIPSITKYMDSSRKETFAINVSRAVEAIRIDISSGAVSSTKKYTLAEINALLDNKLNKSSYGNNYDNSSYIEVTIVDDRPTYEICIRDEKGNGIYKENSVDRSKITVNQNICGRALYKEAILNGTDPEIYQGMIPVKIASNGTITVADQYEEWYDYTSHEWANAVLVDTSNATIKSKYFNNDMSLKEDVEGTTVIESEILQYYVWIPRYKYKLWNVTGQTSTNQFAIDIVFENKNVAKSTGSTNNTYLTHPAFTFGTTNLNGIWVGKFESSGTTSNVTIKPNMTSLTNITLGEMFDATRGIETTSKYGLLASEVDTHMMKNMEWGATAYLSSSIYGRYTNTTTCIATGCEVWINNVNTLESDSYGPTITGCSGSTKDAEVANSMSACASNYAWNQNGVNASTTGNITGIYDMSGGTWEYVMGNMKNTSNQYYASSSGLSDPGSKYYDSYANYDDSTTGNTDHGRGLLGDATKETLVTYGSDTGGWNGDYASFPNSGYSWFIRGGDQHYTSKAGLFSFGRNMGCAITRYGFRTVITTN